MPTWIERMGRKNKVTLLWVLGNVGLEGNWQDIDASTDHLVNPEQYCGLGNQFFKEETVQKPKEHICEIGPKWLTELESNHECYLFN